MTMSSSGVGSYDVRYYCSCSSGAPQSAAAFVDLTSAGHGYVDATHPPSFNEVTAKK